jgi:L-threonylcarbamoyladenylate synthase
LLQRTGPLIAPSANFEGEPPASTIRAAKKYFGKKVDFYADAGRLVSRPSTLIKMEKGWLIVLREGAVKIKN